MYIHIHTLYIHIFICISIYLSIYLSLSLSIYIYIYIYVCIHSCAAGRSARSARASLFILEGAKGVPRNGGRK